jgi:hypothetical protein
MTVRGWLPGRYTGPDMVLVAGPTPQQVAIAEQRAEADVLAGRICAAAARSAQSECQLVELIGHHEGGMTIRRDPAKGARPGWEFVMPDGSPHRPWYTADRLPILLAEQLDRQRALDTGKLSAVTGFNHPDAQTIRPGWAGEPFDLHACVQAIFGMKLPDQDQQAA